MTTGICNLLNGKICKRCKIPLTEYNILHSLIKEKDYICKPCFRKRANERYAAKSDKFATKMVERRRQIKSDIIGAYGGKCECCGETEPNFLTIDHINENGAEHRRQLFGNRSACGMQFYTWLKNNGFPKDNYRLLCYNCNCASYCRGYCHDESKKPILQELVISFKNSQTNPMKVCKYCGIDLCPENKYKGSHNDCKSCTLLYNKRVKLEKLAIIVNHYGGKCDCCGEQCHQLLSIDHVNNDGAEHRKTVAGFSFYLWIIRNNFPTNLRLLCFNCNCCSAYYGVCAHQDG